MKKVLFSIFACVMALSTYAQESNANSKLLETLAKKNILTQEEINEIVAESTAEQNSNTLESNISKVRNIFSNTPYVKLGGYGLLTYKYTEYSKNHHNFKPRVAFISLDGNLTKEISYGVLFELANPSLTELFVQWKPSNAFAGKIGQFKVPLTMENLISLPNLETIYYSRSILNLVGMDNDVLNNQNSINSTGRDIGIQASGSFANIGTHDLVQYAVGMFQGAGINKVDPDNTKDFAGSLTLQPIKGLRVGGSAYFGEATYASATENIILSTHVRNRWALSAEYKTDRLTARSEWIHGNDAGIKKEGVYGLVSYYIVPKKFNVVCNVDYYNSNKDINSEAMDYTAGINYYFYPQCRVQLNYTYSDYSKKWNDRDASSVAAQLQIVF